MTRRRVNLGKLGEQKAVDYLRQKGYQILARNFRARWGEIDIICGQDQRLVFVEVKTHVSDQAGQPEESVTPRKIAILQRTAQYFKMKQPQTPDQLQLDVIAIKLDSNDQIKSLRHFKNITG